MDQKIAIQDEYITLGQLLKELGIISTGGAAKWYLQDSPVQINDETDQRRGKKLYPGDRVTIRDIGTIYIVEASSN